MKLHFLVHQVKRTITAISFLITLTSAIDQPALCQSPSITDQAPDTFRTNFENHFKNYFDVIALHWHPAQETASPVIRLAVGRDGKVIDAAVSRSSLSAKVDADAVKTVKSVQFQKLPEFWKGDHLTVDIDLEKLPGIPAHRENQPWYKLNSKGLELLKNNDFKGAAERFEQAYMLHLFPYWQDEAYSNLLNARLKYGDQLGDNPELALQQYIAFVGNKIAGQKARASLTRLGHDQNSAASWLTYAERYLSKKLYAEAQGAYGIALRVYKESELAKLGYKPAVVSGNRLGYLVPDPQWPIRKYLDFYEPYMLRNFNRIESNWVPPKRYENTEVRFKFFLNPDGSISNLTFLEMAQEGGAPTSSIPNELRQAVNKTIASAQPFESMKWATGEQVYYKLGRPAPKYGINLQEWSFPVKPVKPAAEKATARPELSYEEYLEQVNRSICSHCSQPSKFQNVVVGLDIAKDGKISDLYISRTSGDPNIDQQALQVVRESSFAPLPESLRYGFHTRFSFQKCK